MKLSTKELLTSTKKGVKMKLNNTHRQKFNTHHETINKTNKNDNSNKKPKLVLNTISHYENPFTKPNSKTNQKSKSKNKIIRHNKNTKSSKFNKNMFPTNDNMLEDYVLSDVFCSTEPNSKKNENPLKEKNKENNNIENENYFDKLYKEFKNSNLKKTIIIDNNGNNNLNIPKKCLFQDNNNKKNTIIRNPINLKAKQKHLSTKLLLTYNNMNKNNVLNKLKNNVKISNLNDDFRNILYNNLLSTKEIIPKDFLEINNGKNKKEKEEQKVPENNSIFEDYTNKSIDSSFLGSSLDEIFYNDLAGKKV